MDEPSSATSRFNAASSGSTMESSRELRGQVEVRVTGIVLHACADLVGEQRRKRGVLRQAAAVVIEEAKVRRVGKGGVECRVRGRFVRHRCDEQQLFGGQSA